METRDLLAAIKVELQTGSIFKPRAVFFTPHENFMPTGTPLPACGIKDGGVVGRIEKSGGLMLEQVRVLCTAWVAMTGDGEDALVGDSGVMAVTEAIDRALDTKSLGLPEVHWAMSPSDAASELFFTDNKRWLVKKTITYDYEIERPRPKERT